MNEGDITPEIIRDYIEWLERTHDERHAPPTAAIAQADGDPGDEDDRRADCDRW